MVGWFKVAVELTYHFAILPSLGAALEAVTAVAAAVAAVAAIKGVATRAALKEGEGACAAVERRLAIVMGVREGMFFKMLRGSVFVVSI